MTRVAVNREEIPLSIARGRAAGALCESEEPSSISLSCLHLAHLRNSSHHLKLGLSAGQGLHYTVKTGGFLMPVSNRLLLILAVVFLLAGLLLAEMARGAGPPPGDLAVSNWLQQVAPA